MSDNEEPPAEGEEVPEEEPRLFLKQEQIVEGLSLLQRTAGKSPGLTAQMEVHTRTAL